MPRTKRAQQPIQVPTGMPYGQGEEMAEAQRAIPLPQAQPLTPSIAQPGAAQQQQAPGVPPGEAAAAAMPPVEGLLNSPSNPDEPWTTGLPMGPGAGPEVLMTPQRIDLFHEMAVATGDPRFLRLAQQARLTR